MLRAPEPGGDDHRGAHFARAPGQVLTNDVAGKARERRRVAEVAPPDQETYLRVYKQYEPLWKALDPATSEKVRKGNYERLFDAARLKVRAWEKAHPK